jgi:hypothetical protein
MIFYPSDQSSNRTGIETNINDHYGIYTPFTTGLLDDYSGAAAAYSLRRLSSTYTGPAIRVRRASDNAEQDIEFDIEGNLNTGALASFCSGTDGFVKVWYDQSGNENDATQTATGSQPKIYDSVSGLIEEGSTGNEKPAVQFDGTAQYFDAPSIDSANLHSFVAYASDSNSTEQSVYNFRGTNNNCLGLNLGAAGRIGTNDDGIGKIITVDGQHLVSVNHGNDTLHFDSVAGTDSVSARSGTGFFIGSRGTIYYLDGSVQELILYTTNQDTNRTGIETNINNYYSIYTP